MAKIREDSGNHKKPQIKDIWKTPVDFGSVTLVVKYVIYENGTYTMLTDDLKYRDDLEIIFDSNKQCFTIKNIDRLRLEWNERHSESVDSVNDLNDFIGLVE